MLLSNSDRAASAQVGAARHPGAADGRNQPRPGSIVMFDNLMGRQMRPICCRMAICWNDHFEAVRQSASYCGVDAELGGKARDDQLPSTQIFKRGSQGGIQECIARFFGYP